MVFKIFLKISVISFPFVSSVSIGSLSLVSTSSRKGFFLVLNLSYIFFSNELPSFFIYFHLIYKLF